MTDCAKNYFNPLGFSKTTCKDNAWDGELKCQLSQTPCSGSPTAEANGEIKCNDDNLVSGGGAVAYFDGTKCDFSCNSGWITNPGNSQPQVQCNNGAWENSYTCVKGLY